MLANPLLVEAQSAELWFERVIIGSAITHSPKCDRLQAWQRLIQATGAIALPSPGCMGEPTLVVVTHYHDAGWSQKSDICNRGEVAKPIRETLTRLISASDERRLSFINRQRNLHGSFRIKGLSPSLAAGFYSGAAFLHIQITAISHHVKMPPDPTQAAIKRNELTPWPWCNA
jgi:crossover junction endodeoxyribonuclease RusA